MDKVSPERNAICKNCGEPVERNFCSNCGQKTNVRRITPGYVLRELYKIFISSGNGKLFLTTQLIIRPGEVVRGYLEGKRKKYFNPLQYYVGTTALMLLISARLGIGQILIGDAHLESKTDTFGTQFVIFFYGYFNYMELLLLPMIAFYSYIFFRNSGYNFSEHFILNTYLSSQRQLLYIAFIPFVYFFPESASMISNSFLFVWLVYFCWDYIDFFRPEKKLWTVLKTISVSVLFYISIAVLVMSVFLLFFYNK